VNDVVLPQLWLPILRYQLPLEIVAIVVACILTRLPLKVLAENLNSVNTLKKSLIRVDGLINFLDLKGFKVTLCSSKIFLSLSHLRWLRLLKWLMLLSWFHK
jgi:hypothetical protein